MKWTSVGALVLFLVGCGISRRSIEPAPSPAGNGGTPGAGVANGGTSELTGTKANDGGAPPFAGAPTDDGGAPAAGDGLGGSSSGAPMDSAADEAALAFGAWRERLAAATCARELACWAFWSSEDDCLQSTSTNAAYARFFGGIDEDSYVMSTHTLAPAAVLDACIAAISNAPCDDSRTPYEACFDVLVQTDPRQRGKPCAEYSPYADATACGKGLVCTGSYPCLTCEPLPPAATEGEPCSGNQDCAPGLACARDGCRESTSLPGEGESCADAGTCRGALHCSFGSQLCVHPGAENETCNPSEPDSCLRDLTCVVDATTGAASCHAFAHRGDPCPRSLDASAAACDDDSWCVFETPDAPTGTCGIAPASAGPCALFAQDSSYFCPVGTYADSSVADSGTLPNTCNCKPQLTLGAPCDADLECLDGFCDGTDPSTRHCVPLLADGAVCTPETSRHCADSNGCSANGTCGDACE